MKFSSTPDEGLAAEAAGVKQSDVDLASVREGGEQLASLDAAIAAIEVMGSLLSKKREKLCMEDLPTRMMELRIPSIGLPEVKPENWLRDGAAELRRAAAILSGETNDPDERGIYERILDEIKTPDEVVMRLEDWAHANIAADWDPEQREKAFKYLMDNGCEGMIKTQLTISFGRGEKALAEKVRKAALKALGEFEEDRVTVSDTVPWGTLTAYVKEEVFEKKNSELPLELLGARVGKRAKLAKERKRK